MEKRVIRSIGVVGAGAWGTALAATARRAGREVTLWAREAEVVASINGSGRNALFLPNIVLDGVRATGDLTAMAAQDALLLVVPSQFLAAVCRQLRPHLAATVPVVLCAKGVELSTGRLMSELVEQELPGSPLAVLSGPTFAIEVARGLPTAITLASADTALAQSLADALGGPMFRPYVTDDVIGTEMGGAVKNVLAIACGVVEGRGLGQNARAALITRGLAEMVRLAVAKGAREATCMGLSGLGDLMLTASSTQSRNYSLGVALGQGRKLADILAERRSVAEGVDSATSVTALAARLGIDMPICRAVAALVEGQATIDDVIAGLLSRPFGGELGYDRRT
jgi:glycerol-3-phosphate dehydrogenase (NAD(P)+)